MHDPNPTGPILRNWQLTYFSWMVRIRPSARKNTSPSLFHLQVNDNMISLFRNWTSLCFSAPVWRPFSLCSLSNPFRSDLTFSFRSFLGNRLIFPLLSSIRRSDFNSTNQRIQQAGYRNKHQGKGSQHHHWEQFKKMENCVCTKGNPWRGHQDPEISRLWQERGLTSDQGNARVW